MPRHASRHATVAIDVMAWGVVHAATGYLVHRIPPSRFERDSSLYRQRAFERDGAFYVDVLRIKRWKRFLPEAGGLFAGGFDKKRLTTMSDSYLRTFVRETRRAELGHWLAALAAPLFVLWNPYRVAGAMVVYAVAANGPCIAAQRYNRLRLQRVLDGRRRRRVRSAHRKTVVR